jgi:hypothetical protein
MAFVALAVPLHAQTVVNPTTAQFDPSADHSTTLADGTPVLDHYELEFYLVGAAQPFQTLVLGKPAPDPDGKIRVNFAALLPSPLAPGVVYKADVAAVGPGGRIGSVLSVDTFSFTAPCSFTASPASQTIVAAGGAASATVTAGGGCGWTATSNATWLTITAGSSGTGNGTVSYTATANASSISRSGTLTVAGQTVTVTQTGVTCSFTASPASQTIVAAGGAASATVTAAAGCGWTATTNATWLTVTAGSSGTGNGTVSYTAAANASTSSRSATLTAGGQIVTITQPTLAPAAPANLRIGG